MEINKDPKGRTLYYIAADLILIKDNKVLLQRRANTGWNDGKWNLVGGHIEDKVANGKQIFKADKLEWFSVDSLPADLIPTAREAITASTNLIPFSIMGFDKN